MKDTIIRWLKHYDWLVALLFLVIGIRMLNQFGFMDWLATAHPAVRIAIGVLGLGALVFIIATYWRKPKSKHKGGDKTK